MALDKVEERIREVCALSGGLEFTSHTPNVADGDVRPSMLTGGDVVDAEVPMKV